MLLNIYNNDRERLVLSGLISGASLSSMINARYLESYIIAFTLPLLWYEECENCIVNINNNIFDVLNKITKYLDEILLTEEEREYYDSLSDEDSEDDEAEDDEPEGTAEATAEATGGYGQILSDMFSNYWFNKNTYKYNVPVINSEKVIGFGDLTVNANYNEFIKYLEPLILNCGVIETQNELFKINNNIQIRDINEIKDNNYDDSENKIDVYVYVYNKSHVESNGVIYGIDKMSKYISEFKDISEIKDN